MAVSVFEQCAIASGLVKEAELNSARKEMMTGIQPEPEEIPGRLADILVTQGILNRWQSQQLLAGRARFTLGNYRIFDSIGHGGMGQVFKARHEITGVVYAIKVLPREKATQSAIENFQFEIQNMANLSHPNLVRAVDAGMDGKVYYMVTEYVPGPDLRKLVRARGPLNQETAASIIVQASKGLAYAHQMGLVHRDIKPGNILVAMNGVAKLSDLGLASSPTREKSTKIVGTADYISPDQVRNPLEPLPIWDIYSLGCTLYYIMTGQVPYPKGTPSEKVKLHLDVNSYPMNPCVLNPMISEEFSDVIACMMAKNPEERIPTVLEVIQFLSPWSDGTPVPLREMDSESSPSESFQRTDCYEFLPQVGSEIKSQIPLDFNPMMEKPMMEKPMMEKPMMEKNETEPNRQRTPSSTDRQMLEIEDADLASSQRITPPMLLVDDGFQEFVPPKKVVLPPPLPGMANDPKPERKFTNAELLDDSTEIDTAEIQEESAAPNLNHLLKRFQQTAKSFFQKKK